MSPTTLLKDNVYYWRVRAYDPDGNAGVWNNGTPFTKTFDKTAPAGPVTGTAIKNLHMRDNTTDDTVTADADHDLARIGQRGVVDHHDRRVVPPRRHGLGRLDHDAAPEGARGGNGHLGEATSAL